ncbi:hypothetical protein AVEN_100095-1, partial [Araneus ventricosus]
EFRFTLGSESGHLLIWREDRGGGIIVRAEIFLHGHTDLPVHHEGTLTVVRYGDKILDPYFRQYAGAIGEESVFTELDLLRIKVRSKWTGHLNLQT